MSQLDAHLALTDLARDILRTALDPPGEPIIANVDALPAASAVLQPLVRGAGGTWLDLAQIASVGVADPRTDEALGRRVIAALSAGSIDVEIRRDRDGLLRAFYTTDGPDYPTQDLLLAAGTCALSPAFAQGGLVVVVYDEDGQDAALISRLWTFLRTELADIAADDTALVLVCGSDRIDYGRLCGPPPAGRLFIQGGTSLRRNGEAQDQTTIRWLANGLRDEHLVLFLGAGFSFSSGLALGNELRDIALREYLSEQLIAPELLPGLFYDALPANRLLRAENNKPKSELVEQLTLERVLRELASRGVESSQAIRELERRHAPALSNPGPSVRHLHRILMSSQRKIVVLTVNFDHLVEHGQEQHVRTFITDSEFSEAGDYIDSYLAGGETHVPVLKVHGSLGRPETLVFNIERTEAGLSPDRIAALGAVFQPRCGEKVPVAYIGASMRDQDLTPVLTDPSHIDNTDEYWVSPLPTVTVQHFWERTSRIARWTVANRAHDVQSRFVTKTADDALGRLADALAR